MYIFQVAALLTALLYYGNAQTSTVAVNTTTLGSELRLEATRFLFFSQSVVGVSRRSGGPDIQHVNCLVSAALPVKVCRNCYDFLCVCIQMGPGNVSCRDSLLRSDRLMLYNNLEDIWTGSECKSCVSPGLHSLTNDTLYFMATLNQSLSCFEKFQQVGHWEPQECKATYRGLNELYSHMKKNRTLCIDIEDSECISQMNMICRLWSKNFNCSFPRAENVPVIAVSSFMLFLPIIFYLSSFLHSEQKKRKLIHPKRAKSNTSLVNIQDRLS
uniref:Osteoclastogenesis associated transmembrane protein 1 n=1 Tax=Hucho hucho TaxID=62062 RepID=A0A4W5REC0_9TELE